eukprot:TRINITY_DN11053_c0_g2_i3.p1 TRINITY_DN11053_c0_g2~~TRINITY_DN11053_c0_g2_i3.p1  ORF type:complete len:297 (+),score=49.96 TRINITY_DN11053_c0_g2_i3:64-954(+)
MCIRDSGINAEYMGLPKMYSPEDILKERLKSFDRKIQRRNKIIGIEISSIVKDEEELAKNAHTQSQGQTSASTLLSRQPSQDKAVLTKKKASSSFVNSPTGLHAESIAERLERLKHRHEHVKEVRSKVQNIKEEALRKTLRSFREELRNNREGESSVNEQGFNRIRRDKKVVESHRAVSPPSVLNAQTRRDRELDFEAKRQEEFQKVVNELQRLEDKKSRAQTAHDQMMRKRTVSVQKQLKHVDEIKQRAEELKVIESDHALNKVLRRLVGKPQSCLLYTSPSPRDGLLSRMPSSA